VSLISIFILLHLTACQFLPDSKSDIDSTNQELSPFKSDACSYWPEGRINDPLSIDGALGGKRIEGISNEIKIN
jgi:hypothetical protein